MKKCYGYQREICHFELSCSLTVVGCEEGVRSNWKQEIAEVRRFSKDLELQVPDISILKVSLAEHCEEDTVVINVWFMVKITYLSQRPRYEIRIQFHIQQNTDIVFKFLQVKVWFLNVPKGPSVKGWIPRMAFQWGGRTSWRWGLWEVLRSLWACSHERMWYFVCWPWGKWFCATMCSHYAELPCHRPRAMRPTSHGQESPNLWTKTNLFPSGSF